ncbi:E3 ubiquitin-protein ligase BIG BROTHER-like isoform X3 [Nicotiana tabacum]|uniref:E3 ubiquitin-protein ligase BIG BROTHER-like isoform X3 n=1 Tax=Nicotiana tabacum TaxID=4097 RepID=A0A1S3Z5E5_TOBAC
MLPQRNVFYPIKMILATRIFWKMIDPDNMTYEELLDLGETVGTQSRGLPEELINLLPTTKYKSNSIFSRKKSEES